MIAGLLEYSPELRQQSKAAIERLLPCISRLVDGKTVNLRSMRRDAGELIELYRGKIGADPGVLHSMLLDAAAIAHWKE